MEDLSYLTTEYARNKDIECYQKGERMLKVFKGDEQVEFISGDGSNIRDGFILEFGDNCIQDSGNGLDTIEITESEQKRLLKWLINHVDFI